MYDIALRCGSTDPFVNLAAEEALLEGGFRASSALLLYVDDPCVVVGRNQNPWAEAAPGTGLPVLRRVSGGGAVYHDRGNLNWGIIVPRSSHDPAAELSLVARALAALGVPTRTGPRGGLFYAGGGALDGAKLSGTARRLTSERVLHHGTLLVGADLGALEASLGGIATELSRALPSAPAAAMNLRSAAPRLGIEEVAAALAAELAAAGPEDAAEVADPRRARESAARLAAWDWTWGATPPFSIALPWSGGRARLEVRRGLVSSVSGPGAELASALVGRRFDYGLPLEAARAMEAGGFPAS